MDRGEDGQLAHSPDSSPSTRPTHRAKRMTSASTRAARPHHPITRSRSAARTFRSDAAADHRTLQPGASPRACTGARSTAARARRRRRRRSRSRAPPRAAGGRDFREVGPEPVEGFVRVRTPVIIMARAWRRPKSHIGQAGREAVKATGVHALPRRLDRPVRARPRRQDCKGRRHRMIVTDHRRSRLISSG